MLPLIGSIIGAGASLIGGAMNASSANQANEKNYQAQKEFAQNGLRWKVEDAKAAGIHPVYAMGAPTQSFAPSYVGDTSMGSGLASAGQDIGRAVSATKTSAERTYDQTLASLTLDRAGLENELLRTQIRRQVMETGPSFPSSAGQALSGNNMVSENAGRRVASNIFPDVTVNDQTPAQVISDEYGDWVGDTHGFVRYLDTVMPPLPPERRTYNPGGGPRRTQYVETRPTGPRANTGRIRYK